MNIDLNDANVSRSLGWILIGDYILWTLVGEKVDGSNSSPFHILFPSLPTTFASKM